MKVRCKLKGICSTTFNMLVEIGGSEVCITAKTSPTKEQKEIILAMNIKNKECIIEAKYGKLNFVRFI